MVILFKKTLSSPHNRAWEEPPALYSVFLGEVIPSITQFTTAGDLLSLQRKLLIQQGISEEEKKIVWQHISNRFIYRQNFAEADRDKEKWTAFLARLNHFSSSKLDLSGLDLRLMNFSDCSFIENIDFSRSNLTGAKFKRSTVYNCSFESAEMTHINLKRTIWTQDGNTLINARVNFSTLRQLYKLGIKDFSHTTLVGNFGNPNYDEFITEKPCRLHGINLEGANVTSATFFGADLSHAIVTNLVGTQRGFINRSILKNCEVDAALAPYIPYKSKNLRFKAGSFEGVTLTPRSFYSMYKKGARDFSGAIFQGNFQNSSLKEKVALPRVRFETGTALDKKSLTYFYSCGQRNFNSTVIQDCNFSSIDLNDASFESATLVNVQFPKTIAGLILANATLDSQTIRRICRICHQENPSQEKQGLFENVRLDTATFRKLVQEGITDFKALGFDMRGVRFSSFFSKINVTRLNLDANKLSIESIDSISNRYMDTKLRLMQEHIDALPPTTISKEDTDVLSKECYKTPAIKLAVAQYTVKTIVAQGKRPVVLTDDTLNFLLEHAQEKLKVSDTQTNENRFREVATKYDFYNFLIYTSTHSNETRIKESGEKLGKALQGIPKIQEILVNSGLYDPDPGAPLTPLYLFFSKDGLSVIVVQEDYYKSCFVGTGSRESLDWTNCTILSKENETSSYKAKTTEEIKSYKEEFAKVESLDKAYTSVVSPIDLEKFFNELFKLGGDIPQKETYKASFIYTITTGKSQDPLADNSENDTHSNALKDLFLPLIIEDPKSKKLTLSEGLITQIEALTKNTSGANTARVLLCLAWIFTRLSSEHFFGSSQNSPYSLRGVLALACLNSMEALDPTLVTKTTLDDWRKRLVSDNCTAILSNHMSIEIGKNPELKKLLRQITPKSWGIEFGH